MDQVQSRMFNRKLFESLQRIGVLGFENKTVAPFEDKDAGKMISRQAYHELKTNKKYSNIAKFRLYYIYGVPNGFASEKSNISSACVSIL